MSGYTPQTIQRIARAIVKDPSSLAIIKQALVQEAPDLEFLHQSPPETQLSPEEISSIINGCVPKSMILDRNIDTKKLLAAINHPEIHANNIATALCSESFMAICSTRSPQRSGEFLSDFTTLKAVRALISSPIDEIKPQIQKYIYIHPFYVLQAAVFCSLSEEQPLESQAADLYPILRAENGAIWRNLLDKMKRIHLLLDDQS